MTDRQYKFTYRIIPARAGFTGGGGDEVKHSWDHPRSRGVYLAEFESIKTVVGSSPLARGLLLLLLRVVVRDGIIPARAGFTCEHGSILRTLWDHPRSRGVYRWMSILSTWGSGSSPLARGLPEAAGRGEVGVGIIPARAGFTAGKLRGVGGAQDHPRSRGVYTMAMWSSTPSSGSSPLARGLHDRDHQDVRGQRIIPARAGFTRWRCGRQRRRQDHPRSRGVYKAQHKPVATSGGSSPLARGLRSLKLLHQLLGGIIPARAGFTLVSLSCRSTEWDHPRSRGVYQETALVLNSIVGSSPLARGLRVLLTL